MPTLSALTALLLALLATPAAAAWRPPVAGGVARPFAVTSNPFVAGQHRGIDLRAVSGATVRAPCTGRVVVAGRVGTSGGVVTLLCGHWRVTHQPLSQITVRAGTSVARGARLGTLAAGAAHAGLHLGVRRAGDRFGYVDPRRFLAPTPTTPLPPVGRAPRARRTLPPPPLAAPHTAPLAAPHTAPLAVRLAAPLTSPLATSLDVAAHSGPSRLAPWPAWLGLALVLAGVGMRWRGGSRTRTRRSVGATARLNE
jgi:hypothetical protein